MMMKILKAYGVPPNLLRAIETMYAGTRARVVTPDGNSEEFDILAGEGHQWTRAGSWPHPNTRRYPTVVLTDLDYAECAKVGLWLNAKKTEVITYNIPSEHPPLITTGGVALNEVKNFKYLGSWVNSTEQDLKVRKALAWRALNGMASVWSSSLPRRIKLSFFYATVESVLLYGSECWTLKPTLQKSLDGCYTRMLRAVLKISKSEHVTNKNLYEGTPRVSEKIAARRMRLAGHCLRHRELPASELVLWEPTHGRRSRGRPTLTYVDVLKKDAGAQSTDELARCMENRDDWRRRWRARLRTT
ncbi:hypothetical protein SKAU_G00020720 [Synaphobranchus kaupii]|uniref:Reverse transcriptase n=1 Tax=Synaphobranchus kaupii TaxID=118154 RepID=A0A9Q1GD55_SYNKA|nr:hypothetical protein SKAU_G00020720 [Synaphobranchus kaupii]